MRGASQSRSRAPDAQRRTRLPLGGRRLLRRHACGISSSGDRRPAVRRHCSMAGSTASPARESKHLRRRAVNVRPGARRRLPGDATRRSDERVAGQLRSSRVVHGGRMYFFADENRLRSFSQQATALTTSIWPTADDVPFQPRMENRRDVAGNPGHRCHLRRHAVLLRQRCIIEQQFPAADPRRRFGADARIHTPRASQTRPTLGAPCRQLEPSASASRPQRPNNQPTAATDAPVNRADGEDVLLDSPAAMGGYCPVSIRESGVWVRGRYDYRVEFGDLVLLTAGPARARRLTLPIR